MELDRISTSFKGTMPKLSFFFTMLFSPLLFPSCMAIMMGSGHQGSGSHSDVIHEKEVQFGKYRATAAFPPMSAGEETSITLTIIDSQSKLPYTRADVMLKVYLVDSTTDHLMMHMNHETDSSRMTQMAAGGQFQRQLSESTEKGFYKFLYIPQKEGSYNLTFSVSSISGQQLESPISIEVTKTVMSHGTSGGMGMMGGMGGMGALGTIAVAGMVAVMIVLMATRPF